MQVTVKLTIPEELHGAFIEAAADVYHDEGDMNGDASTEVRDEDGNYIVTIDGNSSVIFGLGQLYQQEGWDFLSEYEVL